jgi:hypothetical protein
MVVNRPESARTAERKNRSAISATEIWETVKSVISLGAKIADERLKRCREVLCFSALFLYLMALYSGKATLKERRAGSAATICTAIAFLQFLCYNNTEYSSLKEVKLCQNRLS